MARIEDPEKIKFKEFINEHKEIVYGYGPKIAELANVDYKTTYINYTHKFSCPDNEIRISIMEATKEIRKQMFETILELEEKYPIEIYN